MTPRAEHARISSRPCAVAWPDGHVEEFEAQSGRHTGLAAARRALASATIRCSCPMVIRAHLRRDDVRTENTACRRTASPFASRRARLHRNRLSQPRRPDRLADSWTGAALKKTPAKIPRRRSVSMCTGRSALSKCPYCDFNRRISVMAVSMSRGSCRLYLREIVKRPQRALRPQGLNHLLWRRHAVGDAAFDRVGDPRRHRQALVRCARCRGHARSQSRPASKPNAFAASSSRRQRVSLGVQALDDRFIEGTRPPAHARKKR